MLNSDDCDGAMMVGEKEKRREEKFDVQFFSFLDSIETGEKKLCEKELPRKKRRRMAKKKIENKICTDRKIFLCSNIKTKKKQEKKENNKALDPSCFRFRMLRCLMMIIWWWMRDPFDDAAADDRDDVDDHSRDSNDTSAVSAVGQFECPSYSDFKRKNR